MTQGFFRGAGPALVVAAILSGVPLPMVTQGVAVAEGLGGSDGTIVFGYRKDAPPLSSTTGGNTAGVSGFTAELCNLIARELAASSETGSIPRKNVFVTAEDRFDRIESGEVDIVCGATSITAERRKRVNFSIPVLETGVGAAVSGNAKEPFASLMSALFFDTELVKTAATQPTRIGYRSGTTTEDWLKTTELPDAETAALTPFDDHTAGMRALAAGKIDIYMGDRAILRALVRRVGASAEISRQVVQYEKIALAMGRDAEDLRLLVDRTLSDLYRSGKIEPIFARHFGPVLELDRIFYSRQALPE